MKYLVLHRFRSYGKTFSKGDVVDESEIRSPYLRMTEGKITPAVFSQTVPPEYGVPTSPSQGVSEGNDDKDQEPGITEEVHETKADEPAAPVHKPLFSFRK